MKNRASAKDQRRSGREDFRTQRREASCFGEGKVVSARTGLTWPMSRGGEKRVEKKGGGAAWREGMHVVAG